MSSLLVFWHNAFGVGSGIPQLPIGSRRRETRIQFRGSSKTINENFWRPGMGILATNADEREKRFVICVRNDDYPVSLEVHKVYEAVPDPGSEAHHLLRVIDESGEDYLYPEDYFMRRELPEAVERALLLAS